MRAQKLPGFRVKKVGCPRESNRSNGAGRQDLFRSNTSLGNIKEDPTQALFSGLEGVNTSENEGTATFTPDGLTMIFAAHVRPCS